MNRANPKLRLTKTDVCRFLNKHSDRFPAAVPLLERYMASCARARRDSVGQFGFWLRSHKPKIFERIYKQSAKHMDDILADTYDSTDA